MFITDSKHGSGAVTMVTAPLPPMPRGAIVQPPLAAGTINAATGTALEYPSHVAFCVSAPSVDSALGTETLSDDSLVMSPEIMPPE